MTSMQRVVTALSHQAPDRVPFFLLNSLHGARELGLSIKDYFAAAETVAEGQLRMQAKYRHDCLYAFFYAAIEVEAWGGEVVFVDDGPPNAGLPLIRQPEAIRGLTAPRIDDCPCLTRVLAAIAGMKARVGDTVPIIGVVISPFSLPVMQMGFEGYLTLMAEQPDLFERLMAVNTAFCVAWANAQLRAGATAICYFDPVSSTTIIPRALYLKTGQRVARQTLSQIQGPSATHFASGRCLSIVDDVVETGTAIVGVSAEEDLAALKKACRGRLTLLGNLNGITMRHWDDAQAEAAVKTAIDKVGAGGGFILADNHGEIPWQVPESVLMAISEAVHRWGSC
ncbi:MAG: uroporphyrinogen decarboxylase family protein [Desulfatitalea sp.]|nr:uroporphyrinogen decarboxylase family protein [Desulfatitalea sp.]